MGNRMGKEEVEERGNQDTGWGWGGSFLREQVNAWVPWLSCPLSLSPHSASAAFSQVF